MTTVKQDEDFIEMLISSTALEESIEWIQGELDPEEVFDTEKLEKWATENGFVKQ